MRACGVTARGTLLAAPEAAGVSRFVAQSIAWQLPGDAGAAVAELERLVLGAVASFSGTDGCTALEPITKTKTRSHRAFMSSRPLAAPCRRCTHLPGS
jgi:hypothetical protein